MRIMLDELRKTQAKIQETGINNVHGERAAEKLNNNDDLRALIKYFEGELKK